MQGEGVNTASTRTPRPAEARPHTAALSLLHRAPEETACEDVRVTQKLRAIPQNVVDVRNTGHRLGNATGTNWREPRRECESSITGKRSGDAGLSKPDETQTLLPRATHARHGGSGFVFALWGFSLALV